MNKVRRAKISAVINIINDKVTSELEDILNDEQEAFDNMPEGLQCSERGEQSEEAIGILEDVLSSLEEIVENLEEVIS